MAWLKLDDGFADHPKVLEAGPLAGWLHVCAMLYCSRMLTDGFIPAGQVRKLADMDGAADAAERLVFVGLWERADSGYQIHDYLVYNPSRAKVLADRAANAARQDRYRDRHSMEDDDVTGSVSNTVTNAVIDASQSASVTDPPSYSRNPVPKPKPEPTKKASRAAARDPVPPDSFAVLEDGCELLGIQVDDLGGGKDKQCAAIKRLLGKYSRDDVLGTLRWLLTDDWQRSRGIDFLIVEKRIDAWIMANRPASVSSSNGTKATADPADIRRRNQPLDNSDDPENDEEIQAWKAEFRPSKVSAD